MNRESIAARAPKTTAAILAGNYDDFGAYEVEMCNSLIDSLATETIWVDEDVRAYEMSCPDGTGTYGWHVGLAAPGSGYFFGGILPFNDVYGEGQDGAFEFVNQVLTMWEETVAEWAKVTSN